MRQTRNLSNPLVYRKRRFEDIAGEDEDHAVSIRSDGNEEDQPAIPLAITPSKRKGIKPKPTFLVGIDFGTTMTSVSYYKFKSGRRRANNAKQAIKSIISWPEAASSQNRGEVPSESLYADGKYYWGYGAQQKAQEVLSNEVVDAANKPIRFAKLFLEDSLSREDLESPSRSSGRPPLVPPSREAPYKELKETLEVLEKDVRDVIRDYLIEVLGHTMAQLMKYEGFKSTSEVELALSVPAGWPLKASWVLQDVLKQAVEMLGFGQEFNLFLVNEPEAASAFVLDVLVSQKMLADVTTYTIDSKGPFRITESVDPNGKYLESREQSSLLIACLGANCGSIYVNEAMEKYFKNVLSNNEALERKGISAEEQIQHYVLPRFEYGLKRIFDSSKSEPSEFESFIIHGIEPDSSKGFEKNRIKIPCFEIRGWFQKSLDGIFKLVQQQLDSSLRENKPVQKVILVGGFSQSPTLRHALKAYLDPKIALLYQPDGYGQNQHLCPLLSDFITREAETLVSRGAVYRAIDKTNGPSRKIMANIGILQHEEQNSSFAGHRDAHIHARLSKVNKRRYINDCVNWIIKKVGSDVSLCSIQSTA
ncbi:uncharacterized protein N7469_000568 [Penicillium citrinum]|uniref:Uncharacterized protein n=1 Tax=Penicillium citrinum TaxID=5077 RepID=A0A9W9PD47_PENCI|nr:uncharacterized protein N7469_000568 [Penicillium citrinum]KAJ5242241.1 hypothetical protein N7469_000568 [Penicillium citrinum]